MDLLNLTAILLTLAALLSYINHRVLHLPRTIGLMVLSLVLSLALATAGRFFPAVIEQARAIVGGIHFSQTLLAGMLSFLLFAGALHIDLDDLRSQGGAVTLLSTVGVIGSTLIFGYGLHVALGWVGVDLPLTYCLLFGALISPTDPIAVLGLLKRAGAPKSLEIKIAGESLFNDGIGVVVFLVLLEIATGSHHPDAGHVVWLFVEEAIGGVLLGLVTGWIAYLLLKSIDEYTVEILLTLALVTGGYALATRLHASGPIAMVVAGLLVGNHGRAFAMSQQTRERLDEFWELVDEFLNAVLFVLIGLEVLVIAFDRPTLLAGLIGIPLALAARFLSVAAPVALMKTWRSFTPHTVKILTWTGLRGGISVALALSIPPGRSRDIILTAAYVIVLFSILVQGLSTPALIRRLLNPAGVTASQSHG